MLWSLFPEKQLRCLCAPFFLNLGDAGWKSRLFNTIGCFQTLMALPTPGSAPQTEVLPRRAITKCR